MSPFWLLGGHWNCFGLRMILLMFLYYPCGSFWNLLQVLFEGMRAQSKHTLFREERKCCLPCSLKALHLWDITSGLQWHFWNWNHTDGSLEDYYCQAWLLPFCVCLLKSLALDTVASIRLWEKKRVHLIKTFCWIYNVSWIPHGS